MINTLTVVELLGGVFLLLAGMVVVALGAWSWSNATAAAHRAHSHGLQVQDTRDTIAAANDAVDEVRERARGDWVPPTDSELVDAIIASRAAKGGSGTQMEFTTLGNEGIEETEPIPSGGFYRTGGQG